MFKPSHLILNLNEMMEAYTEVEEEIVQETQSGEMQEEERDAARGEPEQLEEESRKRKRGAEESEVEQRNERVRIFISNKAFALMEKILKDKGFIDERGFKKLISPFSKILEKR